MSDRPTRLNLEDTQEVIFNPATKELQQAIAGFVTSGYDYVSLGYTGSQLTSVVYKTGGAGGTTVATLTIAYSGDNISSITKT